VEVLEPSLTRNEEEVCVCVCGQDVVVVPALQAQHVVHESTVDPSQGPDRVDDVVDGDDAAADVAVALRVAAPPSTDVSALPQPAVRRLVVFVGSRSTPVRQRPAQSVRPIRVVRRTPAEFRHRRRRRRRPTEVM